MVDNFLDVKVPQWWLRVLMLGIPLVGIPALSFLLFPVPGVTSIHELPVNTLIRIFINFFYFPLVLTVELFQSAEPQIVPTLILTISWLLFAFSAIAFLFRKKIALFLVSCLTSGVLVFALPYAIAAYMFGS